MKRITNPEIDYSEAGVVENMRTATLAAALCRLAAYENTGLMPNEIPKMKQPTGKLKIGDKVIMNDNYHVLEKNKGKVFTVCSKPWMVCGDEVIMIKGDAPGCSINTSYAVDGLTKIGEI